MVRMGLEPGQQDGGAGESTELCCNPFCSYNVSIQRFCGLNFSISISFIEM